MMVLTLLMLVLQAAMSERHRMRSSSGDPSAVQQPRTPGSPAVQG